MPVQVLRHRIIVASALGLLCATVFFLVFPQVDLSVSAIFADRAGAFPAAGEAGWRGLREAFILSTDGTMLVLLAVLAHDLPRPRARIGRTRPIAFILAAYALGPGLLVNGVFKSFWGRARPRDTLEFGGAHLFTPPVLPAGQCARNCSFVSGEASAVATLALALLLLLWPRLGLRGRIVAASVAAVYVAGASGLRIAFGGHFLSDTVFAALLMGVLVPGLHWLIIGRRQGL